MNLSVFSKSVLLFVVLVAMQGCTLDAPSPAGVTYINKNLADNQRDKEAQKLSSSDKQEYGDLRGLREALRDERDKVEDDVFGVYTGLKSEARLVKLEQLNRRIDRVAKKMDKILDESNKTCFPKNTKIVLADGSLKAIDTITPGDKVMIYDIATDTIGESSVNKKVVATNNHMYILNNSIQATAYERFLTQDGWKRIRNISEKDTIFNGNCFVKVNSVAKVKKDLTVYNLSVNSTHNFFVSSSKDNEYFLIHNSGGGSGGGK